MADAPRILIVTSRYYANIMTELEASVAEGLEKVTVVLGDTPGSNKRLRNKRQEGMCQAASTGAAASDNFVRLNSSNTARPSARETWPLVASPVAPSSR